MKSESTEKSYKIEINEKSITLNQKMEEGIEVE
jgi:hypothetical protein